MKSITLHQTVLLQPAVHYLNVQPGQWYLDATLGAGGHTLEILKQGGHVISLDQDPSAIARSQAILEQHSEFTGKYRLHHADFGHLERFINVQSLSGALFDLGISSDQLDTPERGFSFRRSGPLDMRMNTTQRTTAADIINHYSQDKLAQLFAQLADEPKAKRLAQAIVDTRRHAPFQTTDQLAQLATQVYGVQKIGKIHPATKMFQALRIAVNQEFDQLLAALPQAWQALAPDGRLVVISFHSGEDRIIKHFFQYQINAGYATDCTPKPVTPDTHEVSQNPRARSAKLRAIQKS